MNKKLKKEIFLIILKTLFNDSTNDIDYSNCISFYHFLIDILEDEIKKIPAEEEDDISLCFSIIELLCNFDLMNKHIKSWNKESIIEYLKDFSGLNDLEFEMSLSKFKKIYIFIKDDFLLDLL